MNYFQCLAFLPVLCKQGKERGVMGTHALTAGCATSLEETGILSALTVCRGVGGGVLAVVQLLSCVQLFATPGLQHAWLPSPSLSPGVCSHSCPLSRWCSTISSSVSIPFSCPQSFPASESSPVSQLFTSVGWSTGVSASHSVHPVNIQGWFPLGLGLSRVFSNTTIWKHQFSDAHPSFWSNSHIYSWLLEKP